MSISGQARACRVRFIIPALATDPFLGTVCCGVPLAGVFGLSTATLFAGAPFATAAAIGILTGNLVGLAQRRHDPAVFEC